ncbi:sensor histidine kinase [Natranaeroarchaeum aerophilus]|uniref:histidine kinase n=1 Tax=Natranaeroarchaeum aerophilus TaxID=2917711 RepID=A0AAE3FNU6_9EURY|nr:ATP-binding protein [Natranaeroarchaeum aerophilus]
MDSTLAAVRLTYAFAAVASLGFGAVLWRNRGKSGATSLFVTTVAAFVWSGALLLSTHPSPGVAEWTVRFRYVGAAGSVLGGLGFALEYAGYERYVNQRTAGAVGIYLLVVLFVSFVNPGRLFLVDLDGTVPIGVEQHWGPLFWAHLVISYAVILTYVVILTRFIYRSRHRLYRGQAVALLIGLAVAAPFNLIYVFGYVPVDTTPIGFIVAIGSYTIAIVRYQYTDVAPIARRKLIDTVNVGMLVVDMDDRITDSNPAARRLLDLDSGATGTPVREAFGDAALRSTYESELTGDGSTEVTIEHDGKYLLFESVPVSDDRGQHVGYLLLVQDVTTQRHREQELERQIRKLDQFASVVSHDLRNPLNVAQGRLALAREMDDNEHLGEVAAAHERMDRLIDDVLTLARDGGDVTDPSVVPLDSLTEECWDNVETHGARLVVETDREIYADERQLKQLFENLFRNSVEHGSTSNSSQKTDLTVTVGTLPTGFYVGDDGPGVPAAERESVFETGYSTGTEGTGLGLGIVSEIVAAHDWEIQVAESESGGARFEITGVEFRDE